MASSMTRFQSIANIMITYIIMTGIFPRLKPSQRPYTPTFSSNVSHVAIGNDTRYRQRISTNEAIFYF